MSEAADIVRVAAVQMLPADADPKANVARADKLLDAAVGKGAKIVCFPECTLTGYSYPKKGVRTLAENRAIAEPAPGPGPGA